MGIKKSVPIDKKIILVKKYSRCSFSRKIETFCRSLNESNTGSQKFGHSKRIQNSISFKTFSVKNPYPTNSEWRRRSIGETGGKRDVEGGSLQQSSTLKRGVCKQLIPCKKEGWEPKTSDKFEATECYIPYCHFKMEGLQNLKYMLQKGDCMCKLDLKDACFSVPLEKDSRQFVYFRWSGNLHEFLCFCFCLGPVPRIFTKLLQMLMTILRRINVKTIIYSANMLLISHSLEEILMSRDTVIFLLQHLGFVINWKKPVLTPVQEIEFLRLTINSVTLELSLNKTKIQKVVSECQNLLNNPQTTILELTRLIGLLGSTIQVVLQARLNCRFLQMQQISYLSENVSYLDKIVLNENSKN